MDQERIGKFIASCRKEQNLTQANLAEKLGITDRAEPDRGRFSVLTIDRFHVNMKTR